MGRASVTPANTARLAARLREVGSSATEVSHPRIGHLAIIGAFAPALRFLAPVTHDLDAFVTRAVAENLHQSR